LFNQPILAELLQEPVRPGSKKSSKLLDQDILQASCSSCFPTNGDKARVQTPGVIPKKTQHVFWLKPIEKPSKKPASNLIQFQFLMPVIIKDFMLTASNDQQVMNLQIFR